jgi:hypothetical protein
MVTQSEAMDQKNEELQHLREKVLTLELTLSNVSEEKSQGDVSILSQGTGIDTRNFSESLGTSAFKNAASNVSILIFGPSFIIITIVIKKGIVDGLLYSLQCLSVCLSP